MALDAGSRIAQYRLERKLGAGGMGEVYLARDEKLNRLVAIKLLTAADEGAKRRLAREARAAAGLDHPGICAVYEVGSDETVGDFIAMQYIEGETLAARLRRARMSPDEAMGIGAQIAEALVAAHRHGLVHRDLKPQNVIITPTGSARLLDFGLALHVPTTTEAANAVTSSRVTDPNMVLGTPSYMSPEQVRNEPADFRSDVFSLGCVLYECLTGTRAFNGATTAEVLGAILHLEPPPVSAVAKSLGPAYDATCARMLEKIPSERFQSAEEALGAIRALTPSLRVKTNSLRVSVRKPRRRLAQLVAAAAVIVAGVLGWQWYQRSALPVPPPEAEGWYLKGVDAMRDGVFLTARTMFEEAIARFEGYTQAYSRLAEANTAMDDEQGARLAMVKMGLLASNRWLWPKEERLRFDAASAASVRSYAASVGSYQELVNRKRGDAGRWIDLGRAQETNLAAPRAVALSSYQRATELDPESPAGWLRFGVLQVRAGETSEGFAKIDKAVHLYQVGVRPEGEAEALLRKGTLLLEIGQTKVEKRDEARQAYEAVLLLTSIKRYPTQWLGAQFGLAKLAAISGQPDVADQLARDAIDAAAKANLRVASANGLIDLGQTLVVSGRFAEADVQFLKAIELAGPKNLGAKRIEMRAKLQRAALRLPMNQYAEALELVNEPYQFFLQTEDARLLADAKTILSRAHENLEHYAQARSMTEEVIQFARAAKDDALLGNALENLAGQLTKLGSFPQALPVREQLENLRRNVPSSFARDLANHAELLIALGRSPEAEPLLQAIEKEIANKNRDFIQRQSRLGQLRALQAAVERRWDAVVRAAAVAEQAAPQLAGGAKPPDTLLFSRALAEYALAHLRQSRTPAEVIASWPEQASGPVVKRDLAYWTGLTLLARGQHGLAERVVGTALSALGVRDNPEQGWRLAAVAAMIDREQRSSSLTSQLAGRKNITPAELEAAWGAAAARYFERPDLSALRKGTR